MVPPPAAAAAGTVVYDACVLYPAPLRDLLMWLAVTGLVQARWTAQIHDEWTRNLLANRPDISPDQLGRVRRLMDRSVAGCLVTGHDPLIDGLSLPDPDDRHVLAAAIRARASRIVTYNLVDFPATRLSPFGVRAEHPDEFIVGLLSVDPDRTCAAVAKQRAALTRPPVAVDELLATLAQQRLPRTVEGLRSLAHLL